MVVISSLRPAVLACKSRARVRAEACCDRPWHRPCTHRRGRLFRRAKEAAMKLRSMLPFLAAPLAGCAGTATTDDAGDRAAAVRETDCVWTKQITDWDALDDRNLIVYEGRRPYKVELARTCAGLDFATLIGFYDR